MTYRPVEDWASDFDFVDPAWTADPYSIWDELRSLCPVARSDRYGGVWLPTRYEDVDAIAHDTEHFSSRSVMVADHRPSISLAPAGIAPPVSSDPPFHAKARRLLLPIFSPQRIALLEPSTRAYCRELLAALEGRAVVDAAAEYAQHIPVRVIADMLGLPPSDADVFRGFVHDVLETATLPIEERIPGFMALFEYLTPYLDARREQPVEDVISLLVHARIDGHPVDPIQVVRMVALLLLAGIDTTWSAVGASIWHLAAAPADRRRLVDEPALFPTAIEELLRAFAPVTMARLVKADLDFKGHDMKSEEWVLLSFPAANRDPEAFERAEEVVLDREPNRHVAFGLGIHRCVGSHLARMELRVALEEWLRAFPIFELADPGAVRWSSGQVRGPRVLPVRVDAGTSPVERDGAPRTHRDR